MSEEIKNNQIPEEIKDICRSCENNIFAQNKGCAFRSLGNEYCDYVLNATKLYLDLQQKVEQLEKENEYLKISNPEQNMKHFRIVKENKRKIDNLRKQNKDLQEKVEQLESIRKEAIESIERGYVVFCKQDEECLLNFRKNMLNILNKGSEE